MTLQKKILDYLHSLDHCWAIKVMTANERGCPDIIGCYHGKFFAIEVDEDGSGPDNAQIVQANRIEAAKGVSLVTYDLNDVKHFMSILI